LSYTPAMGDNQTKKRSRQRQVLVGKIIADLLMGPVE